MVISAIILGVSLVITIFDTVVALILKFTQIIDWFRTRAGRLNGYVVSAADRAEVGFTLQSLMADNRFRTVQGVFNRYTNRVSADTRAIVSNAIDGTLAAYHRGNALVIYE